VVSVSSSDVFLESAVEMRRQCCISLSLIMVWVCMCRRYVLGMSDGIDNPGTLRWQLVVSLLAAWIFIFLALCKGVKSSGKASRTSRTSVMLMSQPEIILCAVCTVIY